MKKKCDKVLSPGIFGGPFMSYKFDLQKRKESTSSLHSKAADLKAT